MVKMMLIIIKIVHVFQLTSDKEHADGFPALSAVNQRSPVSVA